MSISRSTLGEPGGHVALDLRAHGLRHRAEVEVEPRQLGAVEVHLHLRVADLGGGADIHQTRDSGQSGRHLGGCGVQRLELVGVDLDLDRGAEREVGGALEVEAHLIVASQAIPQGGDHRFLGFWARAGLEPYLNPTGVFTLGAGGGEGQPRSAGDARERLDGRLLVEDGHGGGEEPVGDSQWRALRELDGE